MPLAHAVLAGKAGEGTPPPPPRLWGLQPVTGGRVRTPALSAFGKADSGVCVSTGSQRLPGGLSSRSLQR